MQDTRTEILQKNFESIHKNGFQGTRADKVVADMGITKGALYHYFPSKIDLGYAIVDEIIAPMYTSVWKDFENAETNQSEVLSATIEKYTYFIDNESVKLGCVLNNLMTEMSPLDDGFNMRLKRIVASKQYSIENGIKKGQLNGTFRSDLNPTQLAFFILSTIEGGFSIAKTMQSKAVFEMTIHYLVQITHSWKK